MFENTNSTVNLVALHEDAVRITNNLIELENDLNEMREEFKSNQS